MAEQVEVPSVSGYDVAGIVTHGSVADYWRATQISLDRTVVLMTPGAELQADPVRLDRFLELGRLFAKIRHHGFVQVFDVNTMENGIPYTVLEAQEGTRLSDYIRAEGPLSSDRAAKIMLQLIEALDTAWKQGNFVHRNLKPRHIFLHADDQVTCTNFITGTLIKPGVNPYLADNGELVGTPNYMSPEQIDCNRSLDFHSDMYGLGAVYYHLLTGKRPFEDEPDPVQVLARQKEGTVPAPSDLNPAIPVGFSKIIQKMMAKKASGRYAYWQDVAEDIQRVLSGREPFVPAGSTWMISCGSTIADPVAPVPAPTPAKGAPKAGAKKILLGGKAGAAVKPVVGKPVIRKTVRPVAAAGVPAAPVPVAAAPAQGAPVPVVPDAQTVVAQGMFVPPAAAGSSASASDAPEKEETKWRSLHFDEKRLAAGARKTMRIFGGVALLAVFTGVTWIRLQMLEKGSDAASVEPEPSAPVETVDASVPVAEEAPAPMAEVPVAEPVKTGPIAVRNVPSEPVAPVESPVETAAAPAEPPPPPKEAVVPENVLDDVILDLYTWLNEKPLTETRRHAQFQLKTASDTNPELRPKFLKLMLPFREASSWESLAGQAISGSMKERTISIGGVDYRIRPVSYVAPDLFCDLQLNGQWLRNRKMPLNKMTPKEIWSIVAFAPETRYSKADKYGKALLMLREGTKTEFAAYVRKNGLVELMPFLKADGLKR